MSDQAKSPSPKEFAYVVWHEWAALMSGAFSVPFAALAVFANSIYQQLIWLVAALLAAAACAYFIWREERKKVIALQERLAPKLKLQFDGGGLFEYEALITYHEDWSKEPAQYTTYRCYRFTVTNDGHEDLKSCKAQVKSAVSDSGETIVGIPFSLRQSRLGKRPTNTAESFVLRLGETKFVDVVAVPLDGPGLQWSAKFAEFGDDLYPEPQMVIHPHSMPFRGSCLPLEASRIEIQVLSEATSPASISLRLEQQPDGRFKLVPIRPTNAPSGIQSPRDTQ